MTISTEDNIVYSASVVENVAILFDKPIHDKTELKVYVSDGSLGTLNVDYTVTLDTIDYDSADVIPLAGLVTKAAGGGVWIERILPLRQTLPIATNDRLNEHELEKVSDRVVMMIQQLQSQISRTLRVGPPETFAALPGVDARKGKLIGFDSTTGALTLGGNIDVALDVAAAVAAAATAVAAAVAATDAADVATGQMAMHLAAADPHSQYQKEGEKNQPGGYVGLNGSSKIEEIYLPAYLTGGGIVVDLDWYDTPALARAAGTQVSAWNAAVAEALAARKRLVIKARAGVESWAALPNIELPAGLQIESDNEPGIAQISPLTGDFMRWRSRPYMRGRLKLDGGVTLQTIAGGLVMGHVGMCVAVRRNGEAGAGYGTRIYDGVLEAVEFQNFGEGGLETYFYSEPRIHSDLRGIRLGAFGEVHNSPLNGRCRNGYYDNIFPGYASTSTQAYERNAYGVTGTNWTGDAQPEDWEFNGYEIRRVTAWESGDFHNAINCGFVNCKSYFSSQGFVFENHINDIGMRDCYVRGCSHFGYGTSSTRDSLIMYSLGGIICNATGTDPTPYDSLQTIGVDISDVTLKDCGETRIHSTLGPLTGGAAIVAREVRSLKISDARIYSAYQAGISITGTQTKDSALYCDINGVLIDGVISHASTQRGLQIGSWCLGRASAVQVQGIATKAQAFFQTGSPQYLFHFGKIGGSSSVQGDDFENYAVGAS